MEVWEFFRGRQEVSMFMLYTAQLREVRQGQQQVHMSPSMCLFLYPQNVHLIKVLGGSYFLILSSNMFVSLLPVRLPIAKVTTETQQPTHSLLNRQRNIPKDFKQNPLWTHNL